MYLKLADAPETSAQIAGDSVISGAVAAEGEERGP